MKIFWNVLFGFRVFLAVLSLVVMVLLALSFWAQSSASSSDEMDVAAYNQGVDEAKLVNMLAINAGTYPSNQLPPLPTYTDLVKKIAGSKDFEGNPSMRAADAIALIKSNEARAPRYQLKVRYSEIDKGVSCYEVYSQDMAAVIKENEEIDKENRAKLAALK